MMSLEHDSLSLEYLEYLSPTNRATSFLAESRDLDGDRLLSCTGSRAELCTRRAASGPQHQPCRVSAPRRHVRLARGAAPDESSEG